MLLRKKYYVVDDGATNVLLNSTFLGNTTNYVLIEINIGQAVLSNIKYCVLIDLFK
jgi:hypothetical protein